MKPQYIAAQIDTPVSVPPQPPPGESRPIRVLVIDDSVDLCDLICTMSRSIADIDCTSLTTTADIEQVIRQWPPNVIVMDLSIPGESPLDVMRWLHKTHPEIRVIAFSGHDDDGTLDLVYEAGGWGLVGKNGDIAALFDTIRRVART